MNTHEIKIILIVRGNYKTFRKAAHIFNKTFHNNGEYTKLKTLGNVDNKCKNKRRQRVASNKTVSNVIYSRSS